MKQYKGKTSPTVPYSKVKKDQLADDRFLYSFANLTLTHLSKYRKYHCLINGKKIKRISFVAYKMF